MILQLELNMHPEGTSYISYLRVSTRRQAASGLGLEAQRKAVAELVAARGGKLVSEFIETESGAINERPQLLSAIATTRRQKGVLLVAKLDRLARSVAFVSALMETQVDFICCDQPFANKLTLHILSAIGEHERLMISTRTREALRAAKARGVKLGSQRIGHWEGREERRLEGLVKARKKAVVAVKRSGREPYQDLVPILQELREKGFGGESITKEFAQRGIPPRRGGQWSGAMIRRLLKRFAID